MFTLVKGFYPNLSFDASSDKLSSDILSWSFVLNVNLRMPVFVYMIISVSGTFAWLMDRGIVVCSVLTFLLVGVERYTVLCYPLKSLGIWTLKRVSLLLVLIWTISVGVSIPFGFMTKFEPCGTGNSTRMCCYLDSSPWFSQYETILTSVALFLPIPLLVFLYGKMIVILRKQVPPNDTQHQGVELARRGRSQIIVMLVVLLILFIICLIPFNVYIMWYIYTYVDDSVRVMEESVQFTIEWLFRIMVYVNHMVNPIVYFLMSANFRRAFRVVFCQCRSTEDQLSTSASSVSRLQKSWA